MKKNFSITLNEWREYISKEDLMRIMMVFETFGIFSTLIALRGADDTNKYYDVLLKFFLHGK